MLARGEDGERGSNVRGIVEDMDRVCGNLG